MWNVTTSKRKDIIKNPEKPTFLCDKCVNKEEDCVRSVNEADQDWLSESESESENVGKSNNQATVGKAKP